MVEEYTIDGRTLTMPVVVRRARNWVANYIVSAPAAQRLIAPTGLEIATPRPGKALVSVGVVEYDDTDLGAYHEFMVAVIVRRHDAGPATPRQRSAEVRKSRIGVYIHHLPVDDRFSMDAGRGIWGYPKTLAEFARRTDGRTTEWTLRQDGADAVSMRFRRGWFPIPRQAAPPTYTLFDGVLRMTPWDSRPRGTRGRPRGVDMTLGGGPIADDLRSLGLPKKALLSLHVPEMRATFGAATILGRTGGQTDEEEIPVTAPKHSSREA
jgi:hypothetical protein